MKFPKSAAVPPVRPFQPSFVKVRFAEELPIRMLMTSVPAAPAGRWGRRTDSISARIPSGA